MWQFRQTGLGFQHDQSRQRCETIQTFMAMIFGLTKQVLLRRCAAPRLNQLAWLHLGRATNEGTSSFLSDRSATAAPASIAFPSSSVSIARRGYGSPQPFAKETQVLHEMKDAVLTRRNNLIQTHFIYSSSQNDQDKIGRVGESIALNELLTEDNIPREALVISALLDEPYGQQSREPKERLSSEILMTHVKHIVQLLDVQVLDLLMVRLPAAIFTMPQDTATSLIRDAVAGLDASIADNLIQGYGFAFPSAVHEVTPPQVDAFASNVLFPALSKGCVALQLHTNIQQGRLPSATSSPSVTWIGEAPLDIHVSVNGQHKPLHLKTTTERLRGEDIAAKLKESFGFALQVEQKYMDEIFPAHESADIPTPDEVAWANILAHQHARFDNLAEWTFIREMQIQPQLELVLKRLHANENTSEFAFAYSVAIRNLLRHFDASIDMIAVDENDEIFNKLRSLGVHAETIEGAALQVAQSCPVDCVLVAQSPSFAHESLTPDVLDAIHGQKTWTTTPATE
ncbi:hypothetical protein AC1031_015422 [Aphanomyces cochlioides]|nr:hypothetical protein AC1031_015422 [Aphanomyces cochlioides]